MKVRDAIKGLTISYALTLVALTGAVRPAAAHDTGAPHSAADAPAPGAAAKQASLEEIGAKLADPTANIWALSFNFKALTFSDGDLNTGNPKLGSNVVFQPVMPFPLFAGLNITAPAPSPKRTHVARSSQSVTLLSFSAPMTNTCVAEPLAM